jgi:hypothetical protein
MKNLVLALATLWSALIAVNAQEVIPDFYIGLGLDSNRSSVNQNFNEHSDPFNGSPQLHCVDTNVPGNGGFDVQVTRSYNSATCTVAPPYAALLYERMTRTATLSFSGEAGPSRLRSDERRLS